MSRVTCQPASHPLVSVVMPVRDRLWCLERAIDSVLGLTYPHLAPIVVDDGSTDGSAGPSWAADFIAHRLWLRARRLG